MQSRKLAIHARQIPKRIFSLSRSLDLYVRVSLASFNKVKTQFTYCAFEKLVRVLTALSISMDNFLAVATTTTTGCINSNELRLIISLAHLAYWVLYAHGISLDIVSTATALRNWCGVSSELNTK